MTFLEVGNTMHARLYARSRPQGRIEATPNPDSKRWSLALVAGIVLAGWLLYHYALQPSWAEQLPPLARELLALVEAASLLTLFAVVVLLLWRLPDQASRPPVTPEQLYNLSPAAFERYVATLFRARGYRVQVRGRSGDLGVDLEVTKPDGRRAIVQCKRYRQTLGPDVVRELFGTLIHERAHHAFLVTTADISDAAREWARQKPLTLIDGQALIQLASNLQERARP